MRKTYRMPASIGGSVVAAAALAALLASPAFAQSSAPATAAAALGSVYQWPVYEASGRVTTGTRAARRPRPSEAFAQDPNPAVFHWPVYDEKGRLTNDTW